MLCQSTARQAGSKLVLSTTQMSIEEWTERGVTECGHDRMTRDTISALYRQPAMAKSLS